MILKNSEDILEIEEDPEHARFLNRVENMWQDDCDSLWETTRRAFESREFNEGRSQAHVNSFHDLMRILYLLCEIYDERL